jgi:hypothetical protein
MITLTGVQGPQGPFLSLGNIQGRVYDVTLDNAYPTGGYAITPSSLALTNILGIKVIGGNPAAAVLKYHWDTTNQKLICLYPTGGANASPAALADPAGTIANATIPAGGTTVTSTAANGAIVTVPNPVLTPGRAKEVAANTNLSSITVRILAFGY